MASPSSSDDDSADIAAALEIELEEGSSEPEQGDNGDGGASKRRRVDEKATTATTATHNNGDATAAAASARPAAASACAHPATMGGICVVCGIHVSPPEAPGAGGSHETEAEERQRRRQDRQERQAAAGAATTTTTTTAATTAAAANTDDQPQQQPKDQVALRYIHAGLRVSAAEAARLREASDAASRAARRLHLVLDLDHTLLNSTRLDEVPKDSCGEAMDALIAAEDAEAERGGERKGGGVDNNNNNNNNIDNEKPFPFQSLPAFPPHPSRSLFYLPAINLWTKLRPGTRAFLAKCSERYELAVYTHGDRAYAAAMARLLDPHGELFGGRVISQGDSTRAHRKSLDVVLGSDLTTLILDDTRAVWPEHEGNLLLVDRYIFFPACAGRFFAFSASSSASAAAAPLPAGGGGASGNNNEAAAAAVVVPARPLSWLEKGQDEDLKTGMLSVAARVLDAVHESYFRELDEEEEKQQKKNGGVGGDNGGGSGEAAAATKTAADVRKHLHALRSSVLRGCVLVLSGLAPIGTPLDAVPAARTARALGAVVEGALSPGRTTHVVAAADGTAKVRGARAHNAAVAAAATAPAAAASDGRGGSAAAAAAASSPQQQQQQQLIHCVSPDWLAACLFGWEKKDEALFPVPEASSSVVARAAAARTDAEDLAAAAAAAGRAGG